MIKYKHLVGRPHKSGSFDCYGIVRDFYIDNFGVVLTNYARPDNWWNEGLDLYSKAAEREGFNLGMMHPRDMQPGDLIGISIGCSVIHHVGIFLGHSELKPILHHFTGRLSEVTDYRGVWKNSACVIARHKDVVVSKNDGPVINAIDFVPKRFKDALPPDLL